MIWTESNKWLESSPPSLAGLVIRGEAGANPLIPKVFEAAWKRKKNKTLTYNIAGNDLIGEYPLSLTIFFPIPPTQAFYSSHPPNKVDLCY